MSHVGFQASLAGYKGAKFERAGQPHVDPILDREGEPREVADCAEDVDATRGLLNRAAFEAGADYLYS